MYELYYNNSGLVRFYPIVDSFSIVRERNADNPFIIRTIVNAKLSVTGADFTFFEAFKGTSSEIVGEFKETVNASSKTYNCIFTIDKDVDYTSNYLSITMFIKDKYYLFIDNPEKNIDTEYNLIDLIPTLSQTIGSDILPRKYSNSFSLQDIINNIINDIDATIIVNTSTFANLAAENYDNLFITLVEDVENQEEFLVSLSQIFDFLSLNTGFNYFFYINDSNILIIDHITNFVHGAYVLDLTNYSSINWSNKKLDLLSFEKKFSKISYNSIHSKLDFKNVDCIFVLNAKNETTNEYIFLTDTNQRVADKNGIYALNCDSTNESVQTTEYNNLSFDTFSSTGTGSVISATNTIGGSQIAIGDSFNAQNQEITLTWNVTSSTANSYLLIWDTVSGTSLQTIAIGTGSQSHTYTPTTSNQLQVRFEVDGVGSFSISDLSVTVIINTIRNNGSLDNFEMTPIYLISNFGGNFPDSTGIINGVSETGLNVKPSQVEEIEFPFDDLIDNFDFTKYVKTNISIQMIPYRIERTILDLDNKGFDKLTLKKV